MDQQTVVYFLRHGETNFRYLPISAIDRVRTLSPQGKKGIKRVGEYLAEFSPQAIYSSPLKRCLQTAKVIQKKIDVDSIITARELGEIYSPGRYSSLKRDGVVFVREVVARHAGEHVLLVSHELVIRRIVWSLGATKNELTPELRMGELYRLVFVSDAFVSCTKLSPADAL